MSGDDEHRKSDSLSRKPKAKLRFFSQNLPEPTDNRNFEIVITLDRILSCILKILS